MAEAMNIGEKLQQMADNEACSAEREMTGKRDGEEMGYGEIIRQAERKTKWKDGEGGWRGKEGGKERGGRREGERERGRETENLRGSQIEMERKRHGWIDLNRETDRNIDAETDDLERDKQRQINKRQMETDTDRFRESQRKID
ncbi:octapeptide-repeat protein T2-like [Lytechinus pictus]|uniref:octapeptide-repeat protein T2-like n=1 Tax=Lytechinus pictus TaxID=7653 RepID=UPI0030BA2407